MIERMESGMIGSGVAGAGPSSPMMISKGWVQTCAARCVRHWLIALGLAYVGMSTESFMYMDYIGVLMGVQRIKV